MVERVMDAGGPEASIELRKSDGFGVTGDGMRDAALGRYGEQLSTVQLDALAAGVSDHDLLVGSVGAMEG